MRLNARFSTLVVGEARDRLGPVAPHPDPLLWGEGESSAVVAKIRRLDLPDIRTKNHERRLLFPLPEGVGKGEGKTARSAAFTLIELLVVVAIVGLLAALLLPALARAKADGKRVQCLNNLQQMGVAARLYVDDHADFYPAAYWEANVGGVTYNYAWDFTTVGDNQVIAGLLWQDRGMAQIQQCPSFDGGANWLVDPYTGYNYNTSYIGHGQYESIPQSAKSADLLHPANTALFGDGQYAYGADKFMRAPWPNPGDANFSGRWGGTQGYRHNGRTSAAFCDGHADSLAGCWTTNADGAANVALSTGFLSPSNSIYAIK